MNMLLLAKVWYFFSSAAAVFLSPYLNLYFKSVGFSDHQLGYASVLRTWLSALAAFAIPAFADKYSCHKVLLLCCLVVSVCVRSSLYFIHGFMMMLGGVILADFINTPVGVFTDSFVVAACKVDGDFGKQRVWASISWGGLSYLSGRLLDAHGFGAAFLVYFILSIPCVVVVMQFKYPKLVPVKQVAEDSQLTFPALPTLSAAPDAQTDVQTAYSNPTANPLHWLGTTSTSTLQHRHSTTGQYNVEVPPGRHQSTANQAHLNQSATLETHTVLPSPGTATLLTASAETHTSQRPTPRASGAGALDDAPRFLPTNESPDDGITERTSLLHSLERLDSTHPLPSPGRCGASMSADALAGLLASPHPAAYSRKSSKLSDACLTGHPAIDDMKDALESAASNNSNEKCLRVPSKVTYWANVQQLLSSFTVWLFLLKCFIIGYGAGAIGTFLFIYLEGLGSSHTLLGLMLAMNCLAEVPIFHFQGAIMARIPTDAILHISTATLVVRLLLYVALPGLPGTPWIVLPIELLQGITYALSWGACCVGCKRLAPPGLQATMQGLMQSCYNGIGVALGGLTSAFLHQRLGGQGMFGVMALLTASGWALTTTLQLALVLQNRIQRQRSVRSEQLCGVLGKFGEEQEPLQHKHGEQKVDGDDGLLRMQQKCGQLPQLKAVHDEVSSLQTMGSMERPLLRAGAKLSTEPCSP